MLTILAVEGVDMRERYLARGSEPSDVHTPHSYFRAELRRLLPLSKDDGPHHRIDLGDTVLYSYIYLNVILRAPYSKYVSASSPLDCQLEG